MILNLIVAQVEPEIFDTLACWHEYMIDDNEVGWRNEVSKWAKIYDTRIIEVEIPDNALADAFRSKRVVGKVNDTSKVQE